MTLIEQIKAGIADGSLTQADVLVVLSEAGQSSHFADHIERAREEYVTDDIEIDDSPMISEADDGIWVSAWVWMHNQDMED